MLINEDEIFAFLSNSDDEVNRLANNSHFEKYEDHIVKDICTDLVDIIKRQTREECDAYVIGPRTMGLSEGKAEITIFLDIGQRNFFAERDYKRNIDEMKRLSNILSRDYKFKVVEFKRALPSLRVLHSRSNQMCDLSLTNGFSVQISSMIGHFFEIQPEAIKFYHFIRIWLRINKVNFKAFTVQLLVMNFLQENNFMPSAFRAQKNVPQSYIEGIPVSFDPSRDISSYNVKKMVYYYSHVRAFFRYYAHFNFADNVISTYYGYPVQKDDYKPKLDHDSPMCMAAFLNQKCNHSRYVTAAQIEKFVSVCDASYKYLIDNNF